MLQIILQLLRTGPADVASRRMRPSEFRGEQTLRQYTGDMLAVERYIMETVDKQVRNQDMMDQTEASLLANKIRDISARHVDALEQQITRMGGAVSGGLKSTALSALGIGMERIQMLRQERVSKMLRDHYTVLSLASISYSMLETAALAFRDRALAEVCARHMKDITPVLTELSEVLPLITARELKERSDEVDVDVSDEAVKDVQEAWSADTIHIGHGHGKAA